MFSAELSVWFYCVQENGFLGLSENSRKNHRKSTHPKDHCARSGARGQTGGPQAPCWRGPTPGRAGGASWRPPPPLVPYFDSYLFPWRENPRTEIVFPILVAEPPPTSVLLRGANLEVVLA